MWRLCRCTDRHPGESAPEPWPSTVLMVWKSQGDRCRIISSWSVTSTTPSEARPSRRMAVSRLSTPTQWAASATSEQASFNHSSVDWCTTWNSSSSRCTTSSALRCKDSKASVRMYLA